MDLSGSCISSVVLLRLDSFKIQIDINYGHGGTRVTMYNLFAVAPSPDARPFTILIFLFSR